MFDEYIGWHLELTRRCPLRCPACPRTFEFDLIPDPKVDISLEDLKRFFKRESLSKIKYLFFQGNLGDPIYHPQFHDIAEYFFEVQDLSVITNGLQNIEFWKRVLETWPSNSSITLSIDGLAETNHIYRVNSKWKKIEDLFEVIATTERKCRIEWKFIVFEHNHHQIEEAIALSKSVGIDIFRIQKTRRLGSHSNKGGLIKEYWDEKLAVNSTKADYLDKLSPFCLTGDMHYITAHGDYYPCCWWSSYYQPRQDQKCNRVWNSLNIKNYDMNQVKEEFERFTVNLENYTKAPLVCREQCRSVRNNQLDMITPNTQLDRLFLPNTKV